MAVSKQKTQEFVVETFNLRKLNELEIRTEHQIKKSNMFAALEILSDNEEINMGWENLKENIKTSAKQCLGL